MLSGLVKLVPRLGDPQSFLGRATNPILHYVNQYFKFKLEILKSLGGFYDRLVFSSTGLNGFHISSLPPSRLVIDLHYQCCMFLSFVFYGSYVCQICQLFYNKGWGAPKRK